MLDRSSATPLYFQLSELIESMIIKKELLPGEKLPTETQLIEQYQVSMITVRKAINLLVEKELVERKQGKGTFIKKQKISRNMKKLLGFSEMCYQLGMTPGGKLLKSEIIPAGASIAEKLGVEPNSKVVYISRLRYADNDPVQIEKNYFPLQYAFLLDEKFEGNSLFDYLKERAGKKVTSSDKTIELCRASAEEAKLLEIKKGDYLLFVRSVACDQFGEVLYSGIQIINGDKFSLHVYESDE